MTDDGSTEKFGNSAYVAYLQSRVGADETEPLIVWLLSILGVDDPAVARALATIEMRRAAFLELTTWMKRLQHRAGLDRRGEAALKFWAAQSLIAIVLAPTVLDRTYVYPSGLDRAREAGAEGLFDVGISQFDGLVALGMSLVRWLAERRHDRVVLVELPIGNSVPVQFVAELAKSKRIPIEVVQWNAPRNDRPGRGRTVKDAAKICGKATAGADLVVLMDECLTGSRFIKLFKALLGPVGKERLLPIAMLFLDSQRGDLSQHPDRLRLLKMVEEQGRLIGYPESIVEFTQRRPFRFGGETLLWEAPVTWGELGHDRREAQGQPRIHDRRALPQHHQGSCATGKQVQAVSNEGMVPRRSRSSVRVFSRSGGLDIQADRQGAVA